MSSRKTLYSELCDYCELNRGSIFSAASSLKSYIQKYGKHKVNRVIRKLVRTKVIKRITSDIYYIGKQLPVDFDMKLISFYKTLYCNESMKKKNSTPGHYSYDVYLQYERIRTNFDDASYSKMIMIRQIVNTRVLPRPSTNYFHIVLYSLLLLVLLGAIWTIFIFLPISIVFRVVICVLLTLVLLEFYLRFFFIKIVECYQHYAKEETRRKCICIPSCSEYTIDNLRKYELIYALIHIKKRLFTTCRGDNCLIDLP